jgi:HptB-dependent secretion and biofilm anti anti-sigma factor
MPFEIRSEKEISVIYLSGRLVFDSHRDFREITQQALARAETRILQLDMEKVEYLDSSALGMLLMLKEKAETSGKSIQIKNLKGMARQVLQIANFHKVFTILAEGI